MREPVLAWSREHGAPMDALQFVSFQPSHWLDASSIKSLALSSVPCFQIFSRLVSGFSPTGKDGDHLRLPWWPGLALSQPTPHRAPCPQQAPRRPAWERASHWERKPACSHCQVDWQKVRPQKPSAPQCCQMQKFQWNCQAPPW